MAESFAFIVSNGPKVSKDPALRTVIRKQAMKEVGLSRRKHIPRQRRSERKCPVEDETDASNETLATRSESGSTSVGSYSSVPPLSDSTSLITVDDGPSLPSGIVADDQQLTMDFDINWTPSILFSPQSRYEAMRSKYQIDLPDLSVLTCLNVGETTSQHLASTEMLGTVLGNRSFSYLNFIPSRYGSNPCLTAAVDCVWAKLHSRLSGPNPRLEARAMTLYANALRELQLCISDPIKCLEADTLCATQLLSMHELLDPSRKAAWKQHIAGSERLIKHRKPSSFTSKYERALLFAHAGPSLMESLAKVEHCFLEEPQWQELCLANVEDTNWLSLSSEVVVTRYMAEALLPGLICDIDKAVKNGSAFDAVLSAPLLSRCHGMHTLLLQSLELYKAHLVRTALQAPPEAELDLRREVFGSIIEGLCLVKRFIATLCEGERHRLEVEVQALALLTWELHAQHSPKCSWMYTSHEAGCASSVQQTRTEWEQDVSEMTLEEQQAAAFDRWDKYIGLLRYSDM